MINIFDIEPNKISRDLKGKFVLIYGDPKSGKTSLSSLFPKPLLCAFERGYAALPGIKPADIERWSDFKNICAQLRNPKAKEMYETIVIDTVGIAVDMCEKYIIAQYEDDNAKTLSDIPWGGGWTAFKKEFENTLRELTYLGYGIVFIAHSKNKPTGVKDANGEPISCVYPDITSTGMSVVNRLVDVIAYLEQEFVGETSQRYLCTRRTPTVFAGSRYPYLQQRIPFGYEELVNAIGDAIEEQVERDNAEVTDNTNLERPGRKFDEVMGDARELYIRLTSIDPEGKGKDNGLAIAAIVKKRLGRDARISDLTRSQQDILEMIVEDMKEL